MLGEMTEEDLAVHLKECIQEIDYACLILYSSETFPAILAKNFKTTQQL